MTTIIQARERGGAPTHTPDQPDETIVFYDAVTTPATPIHIGQTIRIHALLPCSNLFPFDGENSPPRYTAYDTGIEGTVVGIRAMDTATTEFVVRNESNRSAARLAYLAIQHIRGETVNISLWIALIRVILLMTLTTTTRSIPLENHAVVYNSRAHPRGNNNPLRFLEHDLEVRRREREEEDEAE